MNTTIISFVSLVVGAVLQFLFTRYLDDKKHQRDLRAKAYSDYMQCVSEFAILGRRRDSQEGRQLGARLADAKCRISLYGGRRLLLPLQRLNALGLPYIQWNSVAHSLMLCPLCVRTSKGACRWGRPILKLFCWACINNMIDKRHFPPFGADSNRQDSLLDLPGRPLR